MKDIYAIQLNPGSGQENLPDFYADFPYLNSRAFLNHYHVLWHWHNAVELFYVEKGSLEYETPSGKKVFPTGSGGLINSGIIHTSNPLENPTVQRLHIFEVSLLAGFPGSLLEKKYIAPLINNFQLEIIPLYPDTLEHVPVLEKLKASFALSQNDFGYEIKLREALSSIWLDLLTVLPPKSEQKQYSCERIKKMMTYIQRHFAEPIRIADIAAAGLVSERECFRVFKKFLQMSPTEYLRDYRLNTACRMLLEGKQTITQISLACGFSGSSFFGKVFLARFKMTPTAYREKWRDFTI